ncbi:MAG: hypothetical protein F6J87_23175 [Spirulina sp. SIO3F2]|nr:hypothetical protein [Spirulina sp. SIO3F2]
MKHPSDPLPESPESTPRFFPPLAQFFRWLIAKDKNPTLLAHVLVASSIMGIVILTDGFLAKIATEKKYEWMTIYYPPEVTVSEASKHPTIDEILSHAETRVDAALKNLNADTEIKQRLRSQFLRIQTRAVIHGDVMAFFYGRSFVTLVVVSVSGVTGVLCLFFISKDGWSDCNNILLNLFVISAGIVVLYGNLSIFLKFEENTNNNTELYLSYLILKEEFLSYLATQKNNAGDEILPSDFVLYMDQRMHQLNVITLDFDNQKVQDYSQKFERVLEGEQDSLADPPAAEE